MKIVNSITQERGEEKIIQRGEFLALYYKYFPFDQSP